MVRSMPYRVAWGDPNGRHWRVEKLWRPSKVRGVLTDARLVRVDPAARPKRFFPALTPHKRSSEWLPGRLTCGIPEYPPRPPSCNPIENVLGMATRALDLWHVKCPAKSEEETLQRFGDVLRILQRVATYLAL